MARRASAVQRIRRNVASQPEGSGAPRVIETSPAPALPSVKTHRTLEELAYQDIRRAIAEGRFAPGQRIIVHSMAAASGVSRIPVLQALRRLQTEGFVRITPHKDVVVSKDMVRNNSIN